MKKIFTFLFVMAFAVVQMAFSQGITLRFTGAAMDGGYVRLDSVCVQSLSQSWREMLVYPDTVLSFSRTGIDVAQGAAAQVMSYPNPFNGTTNVSVTLPQGGDVTMRLFTISGQKVAEHTASLMEGRSLFEVRLKKTQVYLLDITTPQGHNAIKLINRGSGAENSIVFQGNGQAVEKSQSGQTFQLGSTLKIVGYASRNGSILTSRELVKVQTESETITLVFSLWNNVPTGALPGVFTVSSTTRVRFAQGNLQWSANGTHDVADGGTSEGTWRFAPSQWDVIGAANSNISSSNTGWIDLFGWATSGFHNQNDRYNTNYQPYSTSTAIANNNLNYFGYGPSSNMRGLDLADTSVNYDWGVYNAISNGGNMPGQWRALTQQEWDTLLNYRNTNSGMRYALATVNGVNGLILLPDSWNSDIYTLNSTNTTSATFASNEITAAQWSILENAGCVFLPAAGYRNQVSPYNIGEHGLYWSASHSDLFGAYCLYFRNGLVNNNNCYRYRFHGLSVRLAQEAVGNTALLPTIITTAVGNITDTTADGGGNVTSDGGATVTQRGVCWDTVHNPTVNGNHTSDGTGVGTFASNITGLEPNTTYYVRAYAINSAGTVYGNEVSFTTTYTPPPLPTGALNGLYSISATNQVYFSIGNLQWSATGTHAVIGGGTAAGTWRFAPNQWDTIGANNRYISSSYSGWIDLFGWGTSGWNSGAVAYQPYSTSTANSDYYPGGSPTNSLTGTYASADWGVYNAISNGGDQPHLWRTLRQQEWVYLLETRHTISGIRYALATVRGVPGMIIVPDDWDPSIFTLNRTNTVAAEYTDNVITASQWPDLEDVGCAFLPATGYRIAASVYYVGTYGDYWTSTYFDNSYAYGQYFTSGYLSSNDYSNRCFGLSVRLVQDASPIIPVLPTIITTAASNISDTSAVSGGNVTNDGGAAIIVRGVCWDTVPSPTISGNHTSDGANTGAFISNITGLTPSTTYYVRAYATNSAGTAYGNEVTFTSAPAVPAGTLGLFSVSANKQVRFSQGNLQYTTTGTHATADSTAPGTWRFAPNQWDAIGYGNRSTSSSYTGWIDFFGWGTSGYNNAYPYLTTTISTDYTANGEADIAFTKYDWGIYNAISNGGNQPKLWRILSSVEWQYLLYHRNTTSGIRFAKATVNNVSGLIIVPDNWSDAIFHLNNTNLSSALYNTNTISSAQWATLENAGCAFLPAAGGRSGTTMLGIGSQGSYWTSTYYGNQWGYYQYFARDTIRSYDYAHRTGAMSVRLVYDPDVSTAALPTITTSIVRDITDSSAVCGGNVITDGGVPVSARGVCWSTSQNPTISDSHTADGTGLGSFLSNIVGLTPNTTYYVRAYATNIAGTAYGNEVSFVAQASSTTVPVGALPGVFSVSSNNKVWFSQGNLQYTSTGTHAVDGNRTASGTWRFALSQWDTIATDNRYISSSYNGWIDLFGWGTSGWNSGANAYRPYSNSTRNSDYYVGGAYANDLTGANANADWGVYNAISNGGNEPGLWRTLTNDEWNYLLNTRATTSGIRFAKGTVNGVPGVIIVPDDWSRSTQALNNTNSTTATYNSNVLSAAQWANMENVGCAFLPAAGRRNGTYIYGNGASGRYWSASQNGADDANSMYFSNGYIGTSNYYRYLGLAVRLVQDTSLIKVVLPTVTTSAVGSITDSNAVCGGNVTSDGGAPITARGLCWSVQHNPTVSGSHTSNGTGAGTFTGTIANLTPNTTYYVRAYAINSAGTAYGNEVSFSSAQAVPAGSLNGPFSVGANKQVRFSKGNLQYTTTGTHAVAGGSTAPGTWRFATNQWDYVGDSTYGTVYVNGLKCDNNLISSTYTGWIDLFCWGTSGWNSGANAYQPYSISESPLDYQPGGSYANNLTGANANADWGVYNAVSNGGNQPGLWRTLTKTEWDTLLNYRSTNSGIRYAKATVNGVNGLILVPDNWNSSIYNLNNTNNTSAAFATNEITAAQWVTLENNACVFLPATGMRNASSTYYGSQSLNSYGYYSCATSHSSNYSYNMTISGSTSYGFRHRGISVRLVNDVQ